MTSVAIAAANDTSGSPAGIHVLIQFLQTLSTTAGERDLAMRRETAERDQAHQQNLQQIPASVSQAPATTSLPTPLLPLRGGISQAGGISPTPPAVELKPPATKDTISDDYWKALLKVAQQF